MTDIDIKTDDIVKRHIGRHKRLVNDFKSFAIRGNVVDMAVGIVIGSAFGGIVNSFVNDLIMPFVGFLTANKDFSKMAFSFGDGDVVAYGAFIQAIINFFVIALSIFLVIRITSKLMGSKDEQAPAPDSPSEIQLLIEIRDLLSQR